MIPPVAHVERNTKKRRVQKGSPAALTEKSGPEKTDAERETIKRGAANIREAIEAAQKRQK